MIIWYQINISYNIAHNYTTLHGSTYYVLPPGSDSVVCSGAGEVKRFWITNKGMPINGEVVPGAKCTMTPTKTTLVFTRKLAAVGGRQRAIDVASATQVIWAHGADKTTTFG